MNRKRNVSYIQPEDPEFLKVLKRQAGYDSRNHKFDKLQNAAEDFVDDDESEKPQVEVLKDGDLTAEEAEIEMQRIEKEKLEAKADLSQRIIFKRKTKLDLSKQKDKKEKDKKEKPIKKNTNLLSFADEDED